MAGPSRDSASVPRFGLIGCGAIGSLLDEERPDGPALTHAAALTRSPRVELVAVCDIDQSRAERCGQARGVENVYTDPHVMLEKEDLDGVVLATPPGGRLELVRDAVEHDLRLVWCEKPLALDVKDARRISAAVPGEVVFAVNYLRRWAPLAGELRRAAEGGVGQVQSVTARYTKGLFNNGSHQLDLLAMMFGPPIEVRATGAVDDGRDADPTIEAILTYPHAHANLLGADYRAYQVFDLDLLGTKGRVRMLDGGRAIERQEVVSDADFPGYRALGPGVVVDGGIARAMEAALNQLLDVLAGADAQPRCTLADGLAAVEAADAVMRSRAADGAPVRL